MLLVFIILILVFFSYSSFFIHSPINYCGAITIIGLLVPQNYIIEFLSSCYPSILLERGTYEFMQLDTYNYDDLDIINLWKWNTLQEYDLNYFGQGAHFMHSADVDIDCYDEIMRGSCVINESGKGL